MLILSLPNIHINCVAFVWRMNRSKCDATKYSEIWRRIL